MNNFFAIDIGGSYTTIYKLGEGLVLKEPSLIYAELIEDGYRVKGIGNEAKIAFGKTDDKSIVFSPISAGLIKSEEYTAIMLKHFLSKVYKKSIFSPARFLISYPVGLPACELEKYKKVAKECGLKVCYYVPKIICCALGCDIDTNNGEANLIVDIGGSSTDVAVISGNNIIHAGTLAIGGKNVDHGIKNLIKEKYNIDISLSTAEKIKQEIGSVYDNDIANIEISGFDVVSSLPISAVIYASDVRNTIVAMADEIARIILTTINMCSADVVQDISNKGIYICGSFVKVNGLNAYLKNKLNISINSNNKYAEACIIGAGKLMSNEDLLNSINENVHLV